MRCLTWTVVSIVGLASATGCECSNGDAPVTQPTVSGPVKDGPRVEKKPAPIKLDRIPLNIKSNAQVIFKNVKIGAGNFVSEKRDDNGIVIAPAQAKLWTAVKGDKSTARVIQVKVGDTFTVGDLRFKVVAMHIPAQAPDSKTFVPAGGAKASITVISLQ